jgi:hypothetical protein
VDTSVQARCELTILRCLHQFDDRARGSIGSSCRFGDPERPLKHSGARLEERGHTDKDTDRVLAARSFDGYATSVEAGGAIFLVGTVMFFVYNQQAQLRARHEDGPPPSGSKPVTACHPEPARGALRIALAAVEAQATWKGGLQAVQHLGAVMHLWNDDDRSTGRPSSRTHELGYEPASIGSRQRSKTPDSCCTTGDRIHELPPAAIGEQ